jgi:hypothetical protein
MRFFYNLKKLVSLRDSGSISKDEFIEQKKALFDLKFNIGLFSSQNKNNRAIRKLLKKFNNLDFYRIEEININFETKNPKSRYATLKNEEDKLDFLNSKRLDNISNNKPINSGLPDSYDESNAINKFIERGGSRQEILNYFQRSEIVIDRIIKDKLDGKLEDNDPYIIAAKKILGQENNS